MLDQIIKFQSSSEGRLDRVLHGELLKAECELSRTHVREMIDAGRIMVNGRKEGVKASMKIKAGDLVVLVSEAQIPGLQARTTPFEPRAIPLKVLFEDEAILVISKPQGLTVHPGAGTAGEVTLIEGILAHVGPSMAGEFQEGILGEELRPGIVHRLDRDTSGVMVVAKTRRAHGVLAQAFKDKVDIKREYIALLDGCLREPRTWESWLKRDEKHRVKFCSRQEQVPGSRWSSSYFEPLALFGGGVTLARVVLKTGRTHQIRLHAVDLGAPVVGDPLYRRVDRRPGSLSGGVSRVVSGGETSQDVGSAGEEGYGSSSWSTTPWALEVKKYKGTGQFLHAYGLEFKHPTTGKTMKFIEKYPERFHQLVETLKAFRA